MVKGKFKGLFAVLGCLVITVAFSCGCRRDEIYKGEYPDLYTVAVNSILWNKGYSQYHHSTGQSKIEILEKDDYGRTLFTYLELANAEANLVISQYSEGDYVYYYEDFNFLQKEDRRRNKVEFSEEEADYLKSLNDWGKEIDLDKCVKKQISNLKSNIPCDEDIVKEKVAQEFAEKEVRRFDTNIHYLTSDNSNKFLVYGCTNLIRENATSLALIYFVILIDADSERFNFLVPSERYTYQEELKNFKAENGWVS